MMLVYSMYINLLGLLNLPADFVVVPQVRSQKIRVLGTFSLDSAVAEERPHVAVVSVVVMFPFDFLEGLHEVQGL